MVSSLPSEPMRHCKPGMVLRQQPSPEFYHQPFIAASFPFVALKRPRAAGALLSCRTLFVNETDVTADLETPARKRCRMRDKHCSLTMSPSTWVDRAMMRGSVKHAVTF